MFRLAPVSRSGIVSAATYILFSFVEPLYLISTRFRNITPAGKSHVTSLFANFISHELIVNE